MVAATSPPNPPAEIIGISIQIGNSTETPTSEAVPRHDTS